MDSFRERLEYWIKIRGTNPKRLSKDAGLHETYVRDILERTSSPGLDKVAKLCRALDIMPHDLVPEIRDLYPPEALELFQRYFEIQEQKRELVSKFRKPE